MYSHYAFVGESGNYKFDFIDKTNSNYFVVAVILVKAEYIEEVQQLLEKIKIDQVQEKNKEEIISRLLPINFDVYSVVINKKKLHNDGGISNLENNFDLINGLIYKDLSCRAHMNVLVNADDQETLYIKSFEKYIYDRYQPNLFDSSVLIYETKAENRLIQLADFISNVIFNHYQYGQSTLNKLSSKIIRLETHPIHDVNLETDNRLDHIIATQAILIAQNYTAKHHKSEKQMTSDRVNFLKYLLTQLSMNPNKYIYSQVIIDNMKTFSAETISKDYLMSEIIGPLRDAGILIASTSKGYKIPTNRKNLTDYIEFSSSMAIPILKRIEKGRNKVLEITNNEIDIFEDDEFKELRIIFG